MTTTFAITWDYLCPFARNANEHVVAGLQAGADWDVDFVPFSLKQTKVETDQPALWERDDALDEAGVLALLAGVAVRDRFPERFPDAHLALFSARHDDAEDIREPQTVGDALVSAGVDADEILDAVGHGAVMETFRKEHEAAIANYDVFGVPTFIAGDDAVFVRLMTRPDGDSDYAVETVDRVIDTLTGWTELNEFKWTRVPR